jgi:FkbM family methyltransferase
VTGYPGARLSTWLERRRYRTYSRVAGANYDRRLLATPQRTPGGWVRTYDLYNRHGRQEMLQALCARCGPSDTVYDVGASVGVYALAVASGGAGRRVRAYEPAPDTVERLRANLGANACGDRVEVRPVGLGADSGKRQFYVSTYPELSGFDRESATRWGAAVATTHTAPIRRLDDEVEAGPVPDLLKVDVEGAGADVLRGGRELLRTARPPVFVEVHEQGLSGDRSEAIRRVLRAADYVVDEHATYWQCEPRA